MIIAVVTVYQCDICQVNASTTTPEDEARHASAWYDGLLVHICPECRDMAEATPLILRDTAARDEIAKMVIGNAQCTSPHVSEGVTVNFKEIQ